MSGQVSASGHYSYTNHLLDLEACRPRLHAPPWVASRAATPLVRDRWRTEMAEHPDRQYVGYILQGIEFGFRIGFCRAYPIRPAASNMPTQNPRVIQDYLEREVSLGRMFACPKGQEAYVQISPMGVIPKKGKPGKWRLIVDLSSPEGMSINDGISRDLSSLAYSSVDHLSTLILATGKGALLVKADIKEAYRAVPVHRDDQLLLGLRWRGTVFIDKVLPFGLRSAPKIFTALADGVQWVLGRHGISRSLHYLDDFVFVADSQAEAERQKQTLVSVFGSLGVPLETSKLEGPSTCLTFLGIEVDTVALQLRLPEKKLERLTTLLQDVVGRKSIFKKDLESLTGLLQHAVKVVRPGRAFLRNLYALQSVGQFPTHKVRLNVAARADIMWWHLFISKWNGISMLWDSGTLVPEITVYSDAAGGWGCGVYSLPHWAALQWPTELETASIQVQELVPVVLAAALYGREWSGKKVLFKVDNLAVVHILNNTYSRDSHLMHLVRLLTFLAAMHSFWFSAEHIPGEQNYLADAISRNDTSLFLSQVPQATSLPSPIPLPLVSLVAQDIPWTSTAWIELLSATIQQL